MKYNTMKRTILIIVGIVIVIPLVIGTFIAVKNQIKKPLGAISQELNCTASTTSFNAYPTTTLQLLPHFGRRCGFIVGNYGPREAHIGFATTSSGFTGNATLDTLVEIVSASSSYRWANVGNNLNFVGGVGGITYGTGTIVVTEFRY